MLYWARRAVARWVARCPNAQRSKTGKTRSVVFRTWRSERLAHEGGELSAPLRQAFVPCLRGLKDAREEQPRTQRIQLARPADQRSHRSDLAVGHGIARICGRNWHGRCDRSLARIAGNRRHLSRRWRCVLRDGQSRRWGQNIALRLNHANHQKQRETQFLHRIDSRPKGRAGSIAHPAPAVQNGVTL